MTPNSSREGSVDTLKYPPIAFSPMTKAAVLHAVQEFTVKKRARNHIASPATAQDRTGWVATAARSVVAAKSEA